MSDRPELPGRADYAMAFRAIALAEGLSGDAKRVAAIILGHFNTKTGQCDPGTERLMSKAKVSKRTVVNATNELDRLGLVVKVRHGGNGFRSRYQPNWKRFREIVEADHYDENHGETVQKAALTKCKSVHLDGAKACTLTNNRNLSKELIRSDGAIGEDGSSRAARSATAVNAVSVQGLLRKVEIGSRSSVKSPPSVVSARAEAWMKIDRWLCGLSSTTREAIDRIWTDAVQQDAITAEQKTRGAGPDLIMDCVARLTPAAGRH